MQLESDDKDTTIRMKGNTKDRLKPYRDTYGSYEKGIIFLMDSFEK